jgi:hypothetical protein
MCERASARDRAIVVVLLYTGLRLAELVALDVDDLRISARKGLVVVRSGKGDAYREVPLNALVRQVLEEWLTQRAKRAAEGERAVCRREAVGAHSASHVLDEDGSPGVGSGVGRRACRPSALGNDASVQLALRDRPPAGGRESADRLLKRCRRAGFSPMPRLSGLERFRRRSTAGTSFASSRSRARTSGSCAGSGARGTSSGSRCSSARCGGWVSSPRTWRPRRPKRSQRSVRRSMSSPERSSTTRSARRRGSSNVCSSAPTPAFGRSPSASSTGSGRS